MMSAGALVICFLWLYRVQIDPFLDAHELRRLEILGQGVEDQSRSICGLLSKGSRWMGWLRKRCGTNIQLLILGWYAPPRAVLVDPISLFEGEIID